MPKSWDPPHAKFLNPSGKPPKKPTLLIQTSLSAPLWRAEISVLKGYWFFLVGGGHSVSLWAHFPQPPEFRLSLGKPGDPTWTCHHTAKQQFSHWLTSLHGPLWRKRNSTLACRYRCLQRGFGMATGSAPALLMCRKELWLCEGWGSRGPAPQHSPRQRSPPGHWPGIQIASNARGGSVSCFCQATWIPGPVSKACQTRASISVLHHMPGWSKKTLASLHFPAEHRCRRREHLSGGT